MLVLSRMPDVVLEIVAVLPSGAVPAASDT
jgi:hypothetical protein